MSLVIDTNKMIIHQSITLYYLTELRLLYGKICVNTERPVMSASALLWCNWRRSSPTKNINPHAQVPLARQLFIGGG
jgi:hypothetical protein